MFIRTEVLHLAHGKGSLTVGYYLRWWRRGPVPLFYSYSFLMISNSEKIQLVY